VGVSFILACVLTTKSSLAMDVKLITKLLVCCLAWLRQPS
jgi:hypothetical protein